MWPLPPATRRMHFAPNKYKNTKLLARGINGCSPIGYLASSHLNTCTPTSTSSHSFNAKRPDLKIGPHQDGFAPQEPESETKWSRSLRLWSFTWNQAKMFESLNRPQKTRARDTDDGQMARIFPSGRGEPNSV